MKKLSWVVLGLFGAACTVNLAAGCGSDNGVTIGEGDGGGDGSDDGTTNANGDANGGMNVDSGGGTTDGSGGGNADGGDGSYTGPVNPFEGGVIPDASSAETGTCNPNLGAACTSDADCCSGNCSSPDGGAGGKTCGGTNTFCKNPGQACNSSLDCCNGNPCIGNVCSSNLCVQNGNACASNAICCSGNCIPNATGGGGTCDQVVGPTGTPITCQSVNEKCTQNSDCCSGDCNGGFCVAPSYCQQNGDVCGSNSDCCGGICTKTGSGALGICGQPAKPSGVNNCSIDGQLCGGLYTGGAVTCNNSCCSHSCAPYAPTGYLICQPASGCHPEGEICMTDAECCGGPGSTYAGITGVTCAGAVPAMGTPGRCTIGNTCRAPGAICDPHVGATCNTKSTCCGIKSNNNPGDLSVNSYPDICGFDNLGIPRCKTDQNLDCTMTDAGSLTGKACATSADCCGDICAPNNAGAYVCGGTTCVPSGGKCTSVADCCAGLPCTIDPGAATGICGGVLLPDGGVTPPPPPPDGGTTTPDGGSTTDGGTTSDGGSSNMCTLQEGQACTSAAQCCPLGNGTPVQCTGTPLTCCTALYGQVCSTGADCCPINGQPIPCTNGRCLTP
jgi:hypothetical protein